jgi:alkanesulfonate monooxygenase SsuD/methylene tetrahydromethanopterin reductase-like flavin-dependent oxidoreductase (luciferase family)
MGRQGMEFGLFSNNRRPDRAVGEGWDEDIREAETADRLGFHEIWFSEHQSPAELIIAKAAGRTARIRLGSGVRPLGYYHPLQVALEANATDQLTGGRYMLGVGTGFYPRKLQWRGMDPEAMRAVLEPSLALMLKLWTSTEPVDYDGPFWKGKQMVLECPPVQKPHPPLAIAAANTVGSVELAGRLGLIVLTGDFIPVPRLRQFGEALVRSQMAAGRKPRRKDLRTTRVIYVAESDKAARDDMRDCYNEIIRWEIVNTPHHQVERIPPGGTFQDINFDYLVDTANLFIGSPDTVTQRVLELYDQVGGFGTLMFHAGRPYATPEKLARSMELFMREVAPRVRHLDPDMQAPSIAAE